ncbi:MAG: WYL domain-containing protein, partial [Acidimicrobiales bacterium]
TAIEGQHAVELDYYSYGRDEPTHRVIEPWRMWSDGGNWYVSGHCRFAGGERVFRLDRITQAVVTDETVGPPPDDVTVSRFLPDADTPRATIELDVDARWVLETYPADEVTELANGRIRAVLAVTAAPWLERLLLSLGSSATVIDIDPRLGGQDMAPQAAERVLARYWGADPSNVRQP